MLADMLKVDATLSSLKRLNEGAFYFDDEKALDPLKFLKIPQNIYTGNPNFLELGKKIYLEYLETKEDGVYWVETENFFSVIEILNGEVKYKLNRMEKFST
jgi:tRNA pseudouridine55 synthase